MKIVVVGLNHKTAPVQLRERLSFGSAEVSEALAHLKTQFPEAEFVLLSTCNRVEVYSVCNREHWDDGQELAQSLADLRDVDIADIKDHLYIHTGLQAVRHLYKVTASLDSLVLGENQIVGQVKESYKAAAAAHCTGKVLNRMFHSAFSTSKDVHTITAIGRGRMSVAGVAIELAQQLFADIKRAKAIVVGAGQMGELLVKHLRHVSCADVTVINRTHCRARSMAQSHGVAAAPWDDLDDRVVDADILIGSASCEDYLFRAERFQKLMKRRKQNKTLLIIDIAVPRNFEPAINDIDNVYLFSVDDLSQVVETNRETRERDVAVGLELVAENAADFMEWFEARDLGPQIGELKAAFAQISRREVNRFFVGNREQASCRGALEPMVNRVTNKFMFCLVKHINHLAKEQGPRQAAKLVEQLKQEAAQIAAQENTQGDPSS